MYTDKQEIAFAIIDKFLAELQSSNGNINFNTYGKSTEYFLAKDLMETHGLIKYRNPASNTSIVDITQNGVELLKYGGIKKYLTNSKQSSEEKGKLEFEKIERRDHRPEKQNL